MIMSTSSAATPPRLSAWRAARTARSDVAQSSGAYQRVLMPVVASILSMYSGAVFAKRARRTSLGTSVSGTYMPVLRMAT